MKTTLTEEQLQALKSAMENLRYENDLEDEDVLTAMRILEEHVHPPLPLRTRLSAPALAVWAWVVAKAVGVYRHYFPLRLEDTNPPPAGYRSWADVPPRLRHANPKVWVDGEPRSWGLPYDTIEDIPAGFRAGGDAHNMSVNTLTGAVSDHGEETCLRKDAFPPEHFLPGMSPRVAAAVAAGEAGTWGAEHDADHGPSSSLRAVDPRMSMDALLGLVRALSSGRPSQTTAKTLVKLLETAAGEPAETIIARADAKAKTAAEENLAAAITAEALSETLEASPMASPLGQLDGEEA